MLRLLIMVGALIAGPLMAEMQVPQSRAQIQMGFVPLVRQAAPAVVNIYAKRIVAARRSPFQDDPIFQHLFRDRAEPRLRVQNSLGSGVILGADGIVVTNYHVVGQATDIRVVLNDRREFSAEILLSDQESDLAILRMQDAADLPTLPLRNSDSVEVGELALAIGNPFGVGQTVSSGIISGLARSGTATGSARGYFLQTDAPINPGNSGGALIDMNGALVGINTSILTRNGGSNGIGFAIPANLVAEFIKQAEAGNERFRKPWAGLSGQPVDADLADSLNLSIPGGIVISDVHPASPFQEAGFQVGDVILAVDGQPVNTPAEMVFRMSVAGLGAKAVISRARGGQIDDIGVRLFEAPDTPAREQVQLDEGQALAGMIISNVNPMVLSEYGLPFSTEGVIIDTPGPAGARLGLKRGDILHVINGNTIEQTRDVMRALGGRVSRIALDVQRGAQRLVIRARL